MQCEKGPSRQILATSALSLPKLCVVRGPPGLDLWLFFWLGAKRDMCGHGPRGCEVSIFVLGFIGILGRFVGWLLMELVGG